MPGERSARVAVIIPVRGDGPLLAEAVGSVDEREPVEIVVVDDASTDEGTLATLSALERDGVRVLRLPERGGPGLARMAGLDAVQAPFVFPLDADDQALPGVLAEMADALERDPGAAACVADIVEFGEHELLRGVPERLDPYRVAYTNEYPITALYRRAILRATGGWRPVHPEMGYEDWNLWMTLAERGERIVHLGPGRPGYRRRLHGHRLNDDAKARHATLYRAMRLAHPRLFAELPEHRRRSDLSPVRKLLYPVVYGGREQLPLERELKPWLDRLGIWTLRRR